MKLLKIAEMLVVSPQASLAFRSKTHPLLATAQHQNAKIWSNPLRFVPFLAFRSSCPNWVAGISPAGPLGEPAGSARWNTRETPDKARRQVHCTLGDPTRVGPLRAPATSGARPERPGGRRGL